MYHTHFTASISVAQIITAHYRSMTTNRCTKMGVAAVVSSSLSSLSSLRRNHLLQKMISSKHKHKSMTRYFVSSAPPPPPPLSSSTSASSATSQSTIAAAATTTTTRQSDPLAMVGQIIPRKQIIKNKNSIVNTAVTKNAASRPPKTTGSTNASGTTTGTSSNSSNHYHNSLQIVRVGLPLILFSVLSAWVVSNAYGGKLKELEVAQGKTSISIRQAALEAEHTEMLERLNHIVQSDYDNTKRIQRPEEVLEQRRLERQRRNVWYRRWYRAVTGQQE